MDFKFKRTLGTVFVAAVSFYPMAVSATTVTTNSFTNASTYDFSAGPSVVTGGPEVRAIGGQNLTFTSTYANSVFDYTGSYGLSANGRWTSARNGYAGANSNTETITFTFDNLVGSVGGFINYAAPGYSNVVLKIFGAGNSLLESFDITATAAISTSGDDGGAFRGFQRDTADIKSFTLSGAYVVIDDLVIGDGTNVAAVPLPATAPLLFGGLMAMGIGRRRKKRS